MKFIQGEHRNQLQLFTSSLDDIISADNEVRVIDVFVNSLNLAEYGFKTDFIENGRPAYHPGDLLKLFIYGYLNRIRSSRALEKECVRNIELMWLMRRLTPDHNTISNFRKNNPKPIRKVFRATVELARHFDLIGAKLIAGDSTKLRAQNSKKNNFNQAKIEKHIQYIDTKLEEYSSILANEDGDNEMQKKAQEKITKHLEQRRKYEQLEQQIKETGQEQVSTSDPDSRLIMTRNNICEVAYNIQTTVDAKHNLPIDFKVTNQNDSKAMGAMVRRATKILNTNNFTALYDKGYHTGTELTYAKKQGVTVMVAVPEVASHAPNHTFDIKYFTYNKENDEYTCPAGNTLATNGNWYNKHNGKTINKIKQYKTKACKTCDFLAQCTSNKLGRQIERSEHAEVMEENKKRVEANLDLYRKRQAIIEHTYGIIKRQWDFYYIMTKKSIKHAQSDVGLMFTAFNLRRIINIIGISRLLEVFKHFLLIFTLICLIVSKFYNKNLQINYLRIIVSYQVLC